MSMSKGLHCTVIASQGKARGRLTAPGLSCDVTLGKGGVCDEADKREGDGKTPLGQYHFLALYYRPDRLAAPLTRLPVMALTPLMGWCDDPKHRHYNKPVEKPFSGSHEDLWRDDNRYDLILTLSHNQDPPRPFLGSAIFFHIMADDGGPTAGCVGLKQADLLGLARVLGPQSWCRLSL